MKMCKNCYKDSADGAAICDHCSAEFPKTEMASSGAVTKVKAEEPNRVSTLLFIIAGLLGGYAFFIFDVSNEGFVNIGKLSDRQNMLLIAGVLAIVGALLINRQKKAL